MFFYHNDNLAWLSIAKNACSSWAHVFDSLGWKKENLYEPITDISKLKFFGFMRDPDDRHTMGIVEYLSRHDLLPLISASPYNKLLAGAVFDEHCYALSHIIPDSIRNRATFFIIDRNYFNYELLVQNFLRHHNVEITVPVPRLNNTQFKTQQFRDQIKEIKQQNPNIYNSLIKNFLEPDQMLYTHHLQQQIKWSKPVNQFGD